MSLAYINMNILFLFLEIWFLVDLLCKLESFNNDFWNDETYAKGDFKIIASFTTYLEDLMSFVDST